MMKMPGFVEQGKVEVMQTGATMTMHHGARSYFAPVSRARVATPALRFAEPGSYCPIWVSTTTFTTRQ